MKHPLVTEDTWEILCADLERHEGRRNRPYKDHLGHTTIGVGHNLDAKPLSNAVIDLILDVDLFDAIQDARTLVPALFTHPPLAVRALINMSFQLGLVKLAKFKRTLALFRERRYAEAADQAMRSLWARQVPERAAEVTGWLRAAAK